MAPFKSLLLMLFFFFFFNDTATTEIYTLSLHDALPICTFVVSALVLVGLPALPPGGDVLAAARAASWHRDALEDRKSTRLNSSHANISYAVFCLKKKKNQKRR